MRIPLARGPDGKNYTAADLPDVIRNFSKVDKQYFPIMDSSLDVQRRAPVDIGENIPLTVKYNSNIPTMTFMDYTKGWDQYPEICLDGKGNGTLALKGLRYPYEKRNSKNRSLVCIDLNNNDAKHFRHILLPLILMFKSYYIIIRQLMKQ